MVEPYEQENVRSPRRPDSPARSEVDISTAIEVRRPRFDLARGVSRGIWNPHLPELSHTLNAFQFALPHLEPYFMDAIRAADVYIIEPELKAAARAFCAQEANHARAHREYCLFLREHYPRLREFDARIQASLLHSRKHDMLDWRLAYTAAYEMITAQLSRWLFANAEVWFRGAEGDFAAMMTWHAAEEIEHRQVAFDVLRCLNPSWRLRVRALAVALHKTLADLTPIVTYLLSEDGYAHRLDSRVRRYRLRMGLVAQLLPAVARYLSPGYHPRNDPEPQGYAQWLRAHSAFPVGAPEH